MTKRTYVLIGVGVIVVFIAPWVLLSNDLALFRHFGPKYEATRRQVFEETKSYNQGMIQELQNMQFEYEQADESHKAALRSIILHRAADYDAERLPADLRTFIANLRRTR